jgi:hypothetical protein
MVMHTTSADAETGSSLVVSPFVHQSQGCLIYMFLRYSQQHVGVEANVVDVTTGSEQTTNDFRFTWALDEPLARRVVPKTYEGLFYLSDPICCLRSTLLQKVCSG